MNEQKIQNSNEPVQNSKNIKIIAITIIVTTILIGGSVYAWQKSVNKIDKQDLQEQIATLQENYSQLQQSIDEEVTDEEDNGKELNWYKNFVDKITTLDRSNVYDDKCKQYSKGGINLPEPLEINCVNGKITEKDISDFHYFQDKNITIALIPGIYGGYGFKLVKYSIENNNIEVAEREDVHGGKDSNWFKIQDEMMNAAPEQKKDMYLWFGTPNQFTSFENNKIQLTGTTGDAGCWMKSYYEYDIEKNYISIVKLCSGCDTEEEQCTIY